MVGETGAILALNQIAEQLEEARPTVSNQIFLDECAGKDRSEVIVTTVLPARL